MTKSTFIPLLVGLAMWPLTTPWPVQAASPAQIPGDATDNIHLPDDPEAPNAVVLAIHGKCEYSEDGVTFAELTARQVYVLGARVRSGEDPSREVASRFLLGQGAVVRTGADSRLDLFFRRVGTTVRLQPDTEVKFEKMLRTTRNGSPMLETLLDLRKGRIFTVVRSAVPGSTFEIRNAVGRAVMEGAPAAGMGRYIITADGTQVADKSSLQPLKLITDTGITVITPGQKYDVKEGRMLPVATPEAVLTLIEFDELHALAEGANPPVATQPVPAPPPREHRRLN